MLTPPSARLYRSQPVIPLSLPDTLTPHAPVLRMTLAATCTCSTPSSPNAVPWQHSNVNPRSVMWLVPFIVTSAGSTDTSAWLFSSGEGGQKYSSPASRSRYHSPGWSSSGSRL